MPAAPDIPRLLSGLSASPERPALTFYRGKEPCGRLTYGELSAKVDGLAAALASIHGVQAGDGVAILSPNRLEIPVLVLALLRLGAIVIPLNPASATTDWTYILGHSRAKGLCVTRELADRVAPLLTAHAPEGSGRLAFVVHVEDVFALGAPQGARAPEPEPAIGERVGVVLYTSGTTGNPKGVALRQRNLCANGWSMAENFGMDQTTQLAVLPLYHAHAFGFGLMTALSTGGHLVFTERLEPFTWAAVVRAESVEVTSVVPTLLPMLLAANVTRDKVPTLRHLLVSSAPLPPDVARAFEEKAKIPILLGWGLSEYTNFACCVSPRETDEERARLLFQWEVPSIGPALSGTEVRVADALGASVGPGVRGELFVRGHSTMKEYLNDPETTARTLDAEGWLRTGDEGFYEIEEGRPVFFVTGRLKEVIIRDAEKYSPLRLERALVSSLPELSGKLVVLGFAHAEHGEEVGAYVETDAWDAAFAERLSAAIQSMPVAERPKVVLYGVTPIARTHTGKVQRRKMQPWFSPWAAHKGRMVMAALPDASAASGATGA